MQNPEQYRIISYYLDTLFNSRKGNRVKKEEKSQDSLGFVIYFVLNSSISDKVTKTKQISL